MRHWPGGVAAAVERINAQAAPAEISIVLGAPGAGGLPIEVRAVARQPGRLHVALTESGISNQVAAGENRGRKLRHDHVVREWLPPVTVTAGGSARVAQVLPLPRGANADQLALVAFVQTEKGEILQAASLPACKR